MKFKAVLFVCCLGLLPSAFADNRHTHPQANNDAKSGTKNVRNNCEIEIINESNTPVHVTGVFPDDGSSLIPFDIYPYSGPQYIDLYYYGYCHGGMYLYLHTFTGYRVHGGYTPVDTSIYLRPSYGRQLKAVIKAK